jgi:serine/threonine-protein phosphatase 2A catalytic subunit
MDREPNILELNTDLKSDLKSLNVFGDLHGQVIDLIELFRMHGTPGKANPCLFLGDYVNRGRYSVEVLTLLFLLKARFPYSVFLLRGNHEDGRICRAYGHYDALIQLYPQDHATVWEACLDCFKVLPIAAVVNQKYLCVHGGLGPDVKSMNDIANLTRRIDEYEPDSVIAQLLWSDPTTESKELWSPSPRGCGFLWNEAATTSFLQTNSLQMIIRAHQLVMQGYEQVHNDQVVTIFSAPNYCYRCENLACFVRITPQQPLQFVQVCAVERESNVTASRLLPATRSTL